MPLHMRIHMNSLVVRLGHTFNGHPCSPDFHMNVMSAYLLYATKYEGKRWLFSIFHFGGDTWCTISTNTISYGGRILACEGKGIWQSKRRLPVWFILLAFSWIVHPRSSHSCDGIPLDQLKNRSSACAHFRWGLLIPYEYEITIR